MAKQLVSEPANAHRHRQDHHIDEPHRRQPEHVRDRSAVGARSDVATTNDYITRVQVEQHHAKDHFGTGHRLVYSNAVFACLGDEQDKSSKRSTLGDLSGRQPKLAGAR